MTALQNLTHFQQDNFLLIITSILLEKKKVQITFASFVLNNILLFKFKHEECLKSIIANIQ